MWGQEGTDLNLSSSDSSQWAGTTKETSLGVLEGEVVFCDYQEMLLQRIWVMWMTGSSMQLDSSGEFSGLPFCTEQNCSMGGVICNSLFLFHYIDLLRSNQEDGGCCGAKNDAVNLLVDLPCIVFLVPSHVGPPGNCSAWCSSLTAPWQSPDFPTDFPKRSWGLLGPPTWVTKNCHHSYNEAIVFGSVPCWSEMAEEKYFLLILLTWRGQNGLVQLWLMRYSLKTLHFRVHNYKGVFSDFICRTSGMSMGNLEVKTQPFTCVKSYLIKQLSTALLRNT